MKQKQPKDKQRSFEMNGGYFIDGVPYMDCKITGEPVRNVSMETKSVIAVSYTHLTLPTILLV